MIQTIGNTSKEAWDFILNHNLVNTLENCIKAIGDTFTGLLRCDVEKDYFEWEEDGHIVFRLELDSTQEQTFIDYNKWNEWVVNNLEGEELIHFTLSFCRI